MPVNKGATRVRPPENPDDQLVDPDLNCLVRQNERILTDIASLRDDMAVLTAMVMRLDGSHAALLQETRATHAQIARMNGRIRKLEAEEGAT
jgi:hypothetical protein